MNNNPALEIFSRQPRTHNCAQAVAAGLGRADLVGALSAFGGGRAPDNQCGALYAALQLCDPKFADRLQAEFAEANGSCYCRELKQIHHTPCENCVAVAAELAVKYAKN